MSSAESPPIPLSIQAFQPEQRFAGQPRVSSWLFDVLLEIESLPKLAKKIGVDEPPPQSMSRITTVARLCDEFGLSEPIFDMRENGGVEIFCREGTKGLLVIIHQDWIQVFGDYSGEKWRARYDLSGSTWEFHLRRFIQDLAVQ